MFLEDLITAYSSMKHHKLQTFLTLLGIIIGISSVIVITTIGNTINYLMNDVFMNSIGNNKMTVSVTSSQSVVSSLFAYEVPEKAYIPEEALDAFSEKYSKFVEPLIDVLTMESANCYADKNSNTAKVDVNGISADYFSNNSQEMVSGREINQADLDQERAVAVISSLLADKLYPDGALGRDINIITSDGLIVSYVIVGVYLDDSNTMEFYDEVSYRTYVPYTYQTNVLHINNDRSAGYAEWSLKCSEEEAKKIATYADEFFSSYYDENGRWGVNVETLSEYLQTFSDVVDILTIVISVIAGFSLVIGGVGIMNVTLVNVNERVNEIGVRKSLGAKNKDISRQFLIETILTSLIGGVLGAIIGILLSFLLCLLLPSILTFIKTESIFIMHPNYIVVALSLVMSMLIGVVFGVYPANKAAKMTPVDALRK